MKTYNLTQEQVNRLSNGESIKDVLPEAFTLEVGKWYKDPNWELRLVYVEEAIKPIGNNGAIKGYGFDVKGNWIVYSDGFYAGAHNLYLATTQEVETALIAEAKKRGFVESVKISKDGINARFSSEFKFNPINGKFEFLPHSNILDSNGNGHVFHNGKWATIVEKSKDEILNELIDYATLQDNTYLANNLKKLRDE